MVKKEISNKITILLVDDHPLFRKAIRDVLKRQNDFKIIAESSNGLEAIEHTVKMHPDVVIMDINMPVMSGLEATRQIKIKYPDVLVLALTVYNDIAHVISIMEAGAAGYLTKNVAPQEIVAAVRSLTAGETVIEMSVFKEILKNMSAYITKTFNIDSRIKLTNRELQTLKLAARGYSNMGIAKEMNISLPTVKGNMTEIFSKLNVGSRTEAVMIGLKAGIITSKDLE